MKTDNIYFEGKYKVVSYDTAVMARLKDFNLATIHAYNDNEQISDDDDIWFYSCEGGMRLDDWFHKFNQKPVGNWFISAPTQNQIKTWLREKHNIIVEIHVSSTNDPMDYLCTVKRMDKNGHWYTKFKTKENFKGTIEKLSYEDTLEEGLFKALSFL